MLIIWDFRYASLQRNQNKILCAFVAVQCLHSPFCMLETTVVAQLNALVNKIYQSDDAQFIMFFDACVVVIINLIAILHTLLIHPINLSYPFHMCVL